MTGEKKNYILITLKPAIFIIWIFLSIIYIYIYKILVSPKQYVTICRNRSVPKHSVPIDKPKQGSKQYS